MERITETTIKDISEVTHLEGREGIFNEGKICFLVKVIYFEQIDSIIKIYLKRSSDVKYSISKREFITPDIKVITDNSRSISHSRVGLVKFKSEEDYFLSFRFGYFTSRFFFYDKYIEMFKSKNANWFANMLHEFPI